MLNVFICCRAIHLKMSSKMHNLNKRSSEFKNIILHKQKNHQAARMRTKRFHSLSPIAAGPESLEDYFQKASLLGQKAALNLWYVDNSVNSKKLFPKIWPRINVTKI